MKIAVYGGGCASCRALYENAKNAVKQTGADAEIEYVTDMKKIMEKGFMTMPVLEIDGIVVAKGRVLKDGEIAELITRKA